MEVKRFISSALLVLTCVIFDQAILGNAAEVEIIVGPGLEYHPQFQEINVGDTVTWLWAYPKPNVIPVMPLVAGKLPHTVTKSVSFDNKCARIPASQRTEDSDDFDTGVQLSGYTFSHTFYRVETVTYHCETTAANCPAGMWGQIKVVPFGAKTIKVDKSKYQLGGIQILPQPLEDAADAAQKILFGGLGAFGLGR